MTVNKKAYFPLKAIRLNRFELHCTHTQRERERERERELRVLGRNRSRAIGWQNRAA